MTPASRRTRVGLAGRHDAQRVRAGLQVVNLPENVVRIGDDVGIEPQLRLGRQKDIRAAAELVERTETAITPSNLSTVRCRPDRDLESRSVSRPDRSGRLAGLDPAVRDAGVPLFERAPPVAGREPRSRCCDHTAGGRDVLERLISVDFTMSLKE
jgi:hypothetical protein